MNDHVTIELPPNDIEACEAVLHHWHPEDVSQLQDVYTWAVRQSRWRTDYEEAD